MSEVDKIIEETHRRNRPMPEMFTVKTYATLVGGM